MNKLSLTALKERAETIVSEELLSAINGGLQNDCHAIVVQNPNGTVDIIIK